MQKDVWTSPYNVIKEVTQNFRLPARIGLYDCTLRDGEQVPGLVFKKMRRYK